MHTDACKGVQLFLLLCEERMCTHLVPQCLRRRAQVWQTQSLIEPISVNFYQINLNLSHSLRRVLVFQFSYFRHASILCILIVHGCVHNTTLPWPPTRFKGLLTFSSSIYICFVLFNVDPFVLCLHQPISTSSTRFP